MLKIFDYIVFRVYEYFVRKKREDALSKSIQFLIYFQISSLIPIFLPVKLIMKIDLHKYVDWNNHKFLIAIPITSLLILLNNRYKKKLEGGKLKVLQEKYHKEKYKLPLWVIFFSPIFFLLICPILYGALNGTLRFFPR